MDLLRWAARTRRNCPPKATPINRHQHRSSRRDVLVGSVADFSVFGPLGPVAGAVLGPTATTFIDVRDVIQRRKHENGLARY